VCVCVCERERSLLTVFIYQEEEEACMDFELIRYREEMIIDPFLTCEFLTVMHFCMDIHCLLYAKEKTPVHCCFSVISCLKYSKTVHLRTIMT